MGLIYIKDTNMNTIEQLEKHLVNQQIHNANKRSCKVCNREIFYFYIYCDKCGVKI